MFIDKIIDKLQVKSILDISCNYETISDNLEMYIGIDTDRSKILNLRTKNFNKNNKIFFDLDHIRENLPKTDLIIINKYDIRETWILIEKSKYFSKYSVHLIEKSNKFGTKKECIVVLTSNEFR